MSIKSRMLAAAAVLTLAGGLSAAGTVAASAATPQCADNCLTPESAAYPGFVETALFGIPRRGVPTIVSPAAGGTRGRTSPSRQVVRCTRPTSTPTVWCRPRSLAIMGARAISRFRSSTRPIGYALLDSPVALAAWMLDHDTDSYYKISGAFAHGQPAGGLTRDAVVDNITLYWLTGTGASAARSYWEGGQPQLARPARLLWRSHSRSASPRSPARSSGPREAGPRSFTPTSSTSTRPAGRPFRCLGRAATVFRRTPRGLPAAPLDDCTPGRG